MNAVIHTFNNCSAEWLASMARACWQGGLFVLAIWAVCRLAPRLPAATRHILWLLACMKLLIGIIWASSIPIGVLPPPEAGPSLPQITPSVGLSAVGMQAAGLPAMETPTVEMLPAKTPAVDTPITARPTSDPKTSVFNPQPSSLIPSHFPFQISYFPPSSLLFLTWIIGVSGHLVRLRKQGQWAARLRANSRTLQDERIYQEAESLARSLSIRRVPLFLVSDEAPGPLLTGALRPAIILPRELSPCEMRMALAHELSHFKRHDLWWSAVSTLVYALFFFFAPAWLAAREVALACEAACDHEAVVLTGEIPAVYGDFLLRLLAAGESSLPSAVLAATPAFRTMKGRITMLYQLSSPSERRWKVGLISLVVLATLALVPWMLAPRPNADLQTVLNALAKHPTRIQSAYFEYHRTWITPYHPDNFWESVEVPGAHEHPGATLTATVLSKPRLDRFVTAIKDGQYYNGQSGAVEVQNGGLFYRLARLSNQPWEVMQYSYPFHRPTPIDWAYKTDGDWTINILRRTHPRVIAMSHDPEFGRIIQIEAREPCGATTHLHTWWFAADYGCLAVRNELNVSDVTSAKSQISLSCTSHRLQRVNGVWLPMTAVEKTWYIQRKPHSNPELLSDRRMEISRANVNDVPDSQFQLPPLPAGTIYRVIQQNGEDHYVIGKRGEKVFVRHVTHGPSSTVHFPSVPYYPGISWVFYPEVSQAARQASLTQVTKMREVWRDWAYQHRVALQRMLRASPSDNTALAGVFTALPKMPDPGLRSLLNVRSGLLPMFTWQIPSSAERSGLSQGKPIFWWGRVGRDFTEQHDIALSYSMQTGVRRMIFWVSGKVTEDIPTPNHPYDGLPQQILPPYAFLE